MDFAQVETKYRELKREYDTGAITEEEFKAQLEELMIEDEEGKWWIIGYETGQWYYHDGEKWVQGEPPGRVAVRAAPQPTARPVAPAGPKPRRFWGIVVLLLGLALTFTAGIWTDQYLICASVWLGGLILTIFITRKVWRGK